MKYASTPVTTLITNTQMKTQHHATPRSRLGEAFDLTWNDKLRVGHSKIDDMHIEFIDLANSLLHCTEASAKKCLEELQKHIQEHFDSEKELMEKSEFPASDCHLDEHGKVYEAVSQVKDRFSQGDILLNDVHRLAKALIDWFPGHIFYMDSALSTWLSKKNHRGSPLIFQRPNYKI